MLSNKDTDGDSSIFRLDDTVRTDNELQANLVFFEELSVSRGCAMLIAKNYL